MATVGGGGDWARAATAEAGKPARAAAAAANTHALVRRLADGVQRRERAHGAHGARQAQRHRQRELRVHVRRQRRRVLAVARLEEPLEVHRRVARVRQHRQARRHERAAKHGVNKVSCFCVGGGHSDGPFLWRRVQA